MAETTQPGLATYVSHLLDSLWSTITPSRDSTEPNPTRAIAPPAIPMDALLSLAFDNISSPSLSKIRKGLRQIEGILAQICLSSPFSQSSQSPSKRRTSLLNPPQNPSSPLKTLADLPSDPAFLTFFHLQDTFSHNLTTRLLTTLERLLGHPNATTTTTLTLSTLTLLHGALLLHPPSRSLFRHENTMTLLLDLLDPSSPPHLQSAALSVLSSAILGRPANARVFDDGSDGLATVASLYNAKATDPFVRGKIEELLGVYVGSETSALPLGVSQSEPNTAVRGSPRKEGVVERRASTVNGDGGGGGGGGSESGLWDDGGRGTVTRSVGEKKRLLARYFGDVEEVLDGVKGLGFVDMVG